MLPEAQAVLEAGGCKGPMSGCHVCVTGYSSVDREHVHTMVKAGGGQWTPELYKACTHLIAKDTSGQKYK